MELGQGGIEDKWRQGREGKRRVGKRGKRRDGHVPLFAIVTRLKDIDTAAGEGERLGAHERD